jgi:PII-like signaling protein
MDTPIDAGPSVSGSDDERLLLRIFVGEDDRHEGRPLYQAIIETLRANNLAGATVLKGIEGFGKSSRLHTSSVLRLSEDLPILIECVSRTEKIERILPELDAMIGDGLITTQPVTVRVYRGEAPDRRVDG